jgi:hypothetical protein
MVQLRMSLPTNRLLNDGKLTLAMELREFQRSVVTGWKGRRKAVAECSQLLLVLPANDQFVLRRMQSGYKHAQRRCPKRSALG